MCALKNWNHRICDKGYNHLFEQHQQHNNYLLSQMKNGMQIYISTRFTLFYYVSLYPIPPCYIAMCCFLLLYLALIFIFFFIVFTSCQLFCLFCSTLFSSIVILSCPYMYLYSIYVTYFYSVLFYSNPLNSILFYEFIFYNLHSILFVCLPSCCKHVL